MIPVTIPFLPSKQEYNNLMDGIWERNWLTNHGPLTEELENEIKKYLKVEHFKLVSNGTIALQMAIKAFKLSGDIITTPFTYVASTSSIVWEGCNPVFADIDPHTYNIDPDKIEAAITKNTCAILATHVFGNPCHLERIDQIAQKHKLTVIYDAAHAFKVEYKGQSIFSYGDASTTSFHATKIFHTIEGGGVFCKVDQLDYRISRMRNFGHKGPEDFEGVGINGKVSEFHSAMGLVNLKYIDEILKVRKSQYKLYKEILTDSTLQFQKIGEDVGYNYSYFPVLFKDEKELLKTVALLNSNDIYPRRYFYPILSELPYVVKVHMPVAESISKRILCLPIYHSLSNQEIKNISNIILNSLP